MHFGRIKLKLFILLCANFNGLAIHSQKMVFFQIKLQHENIFIPVGTAITALERRAKEEENISQFEVTNLIGINAIS